MAKPKNLAEAMEILKEAVERSENFSSADFDIFIEAILRVAIPENEQAWMKEIAATSNFPLWVVVFANWRKSWEWHECHQAISFIDPRWEELVVAEREAAKSQGVSG